MYHAIEIIGTGKNRRYTIRQVIHKGLTWPTNGRTYRTEEDARAAAAEMGIEIAKCGDHYEII